MIHMVMLALTLVVFAFFAVFIEREKVKVGGKKILGRILDKVCDITKIIRKSAIRRFNRASRG